jgi:long-chain acyl-CoA synthetase
LAERNSSRIIFALAHCSPAVARLPNTYWIVGDISESRLGLGEHLYAQLCASVATIVHCAASTKFTLPLDESRKTNVHGTENLLQFARRAKSLKLLLHVSTVYIAGRKSGPLCEAELRHPDGWFSPYEQSKFEAEKLIFESGLPWAIALR